MNKPPNNQALGNPWCIAHGEIQMEASSRVKRFVVSEAAFLYPYYKNIAKLLGVADRSGGMIIDNADWTLISGKFQTEMGELISVEGEMIELLTPDFDYCLKRLETDYQEISNPQN